MKNEEIKIKNEAVAEEIMRLVNIMGNEEDLGKILGDTVAGDHRTLQQSFWRTFQIAASRYADLMDGHTDLRNEASVEFTKNIRDKSFYLPYI